MRTLGPLVRVTPLTGLVVPPSPRLVVRLGWQLEMVVVRTVVLVAVKVLRAVLSTRVVAAMRTMLMLVGMGSEMGFEISAMRVLRVVVVVVTVHFTPFEDVPERQCIGLIGLRAGFVATMTWCLVRLLWV